VALRGACPAGKRYAHIREFIERHDQPGAPLIATRAGICVELDDLDKLQACVDALVKAVADTRNESDPKTCRLTATLTYRLRTGSVGREVRWGTPDDRDQLSAHAGVEALGLNSATSSGLI
jgi:hypothetical protein